MTIVIFVQTVITVKLRKGFNLQKKFRLVHMYMYMYVQIVLNVEYVQLILHVHV